MRRFPRARWRSRSSGRDPGAGPRGPCRWCSALSARESERSGAECVLSLADAGVEPLVLAGEVKPPVLPEIPVRDDGPQGENRLRAVQAPPGASQIEAVG